MTYEISDFQNDVIKRSHTVPVLVDFWADWCGPCKVLGPVLERLAEKSNHQWTLVKVDTDKNQILARQYGIKGIPNVKLFVDGKVVNEFTGALPEAAVARWLKKTLPDKFRKEIERAEQMLKAKNTGGAQSVLEEIIKQDPGHQHARVLLAQSLIFSDPDEAVDLVDGIEEHSEHFPMVEAIRTFNSLTMKLLHLDSLPDDPVKPTYVAALTELGAFNYDGAIERFIEVIRTARYYDDDGARKACIVVFRILGEEHEVTQKRRREFGSALYV